jgi:hypothetical protein
MIVNTRARNRPWLRDLLHLFMKRIILCLFTFLLFIFCVKPDRFEIIKNDDFSSVNKGQYRGTPAFLRDGAKYKPMVDDFRSDIAEHFPLLPKITRHIFDIQDSLLYKFKYAAIDSNANVLILRYFSRIYNHPMLAGYQIQFVFDLQSTGLSEIFVDEVPLE